MYQVAVTVEPVHQTIALFGVIIGGIQASAATPSMKLRYLLLMWHTGAGDEGGR